MWVKGYVRQRERRPQWLRACAESKESGEEKASPGQRAGFESRRPRNAELSDSALGVSRLRGHVVCAVTQRPRCGRAPCPVRCSVLAIVALMELFEQGALRLQLARGPPSYVACPSWE